MFHSNMIANIFTFSPSTRKGSVIEILSQIQLKTHPCLPEVQL